jgi:enoyl-CoA hydratase/carnithine racemase
MISYELREETAWITIDRPEKANAIHPDGWRALADAVELAGEESRVAVLTGAGEMFSAGDDIAELATFEDTADVEELTEAVYGAYHGIERTDVPVVAAVNGPALGGGLELVVACDLAVASDEATFALPEGRIGAYPPFAVERIGHAGGRKRMMELVLTGESIDATTATEWGLVNRVVPPADLADEVGSLVGAICRSPRRSVRIAKQYVNGTAAAVAERERMTGAFSELLLAGDLERGVEAFLADR